MNSTGNFDSKGLTKVKFPVHLGEAQSDSQVDAARTAGNVGNFAGKNSVAIDCVCHEINLGVRALSLSIRQIDMRVNKSGR